MQFYVVYKDDYQYSEVFCNMERAQEYLYFVQIMEPNSYLHIESILEEEETMEEETMNFFELLKLWEHLEDMTPKTKEKSLLPNQERDGKFSYWRNIKMAWIEHKIETNQEREIKAIQE